jgi:DNA-binding MarR family transcriptional regulator
MSSKPAAPAPFQLCSLIGRIRSELYTSIEAELARQGFELGFSQFVALKKLGTEGPMAAGELARLLNHNPGALTRLLDKLEQQDYVRRVPDPNDRRALRIELTASGRTLWKRINACGERVAERALDRSTEKERMQLQTLLNRVLDNLRTSA